jgi:DNA-binding transcriptional ArsR family regulator
MDGVVKRQSFSDEGPLTEGAAQAAALLKALAHPGRLEILCLLAENPCTVGEMEKALGLPQAAVSQQLMRLRADGLVQRERQGRHIRYSLDRPEVRGIIQLLQQTFCPPE